ncbi:uncharacterized protein LOC110444296 [Mizuhopecten yessoensis]|uniref:uncharacterized protein LOC110444296 n=1 Tax=Mizuhopecten yessoensis TaxID=6573 RepID=UPI000B45A416|nr:uncharacterized protein LOC110444296 [Mizuhopecten yessoensis]
MLEDICLCFLFFSGKSWPQQYTGMQIIKEVYFDIDSLGPVYSLQYSYDGESLAVGFGNGAIRLYESRTGEFIKELRKPRYGGLQIMCLRFHTKVHHILLASTADGKVFECNTKDDSIAEVISGQSYWSLAFLVNLTDHQAGISHWSASLVTALPGQSHRSLTLYLSLVSFTGHLPQWSVLLRCLVHVYLYKILTRYIAIEMFLIGLSKICQIFWYGN